IVYEDAFHWRWGGGNRTVAALFKPQEGLLVQIVSAVLVEHREERAREVEGDGKEDAIRFALEKQSMGSVPISKLGNVAQEAQGLLGRKKGRFDFEGVAPLPCACGTRLRVRAPVQQNPLERFGVVGVFVRAGEVPGVNEQNL